MSRSKANNTQMAQGARPDLIVLRLNEEATMGTWGVTQKEVLNICFTTAAISMPIGILLSAASSGFIGIVYLLGGFASTLGIIWFRVQRRSKLKADKPYGYFEQLTKTHGWLVRLGFKKPPTLQVSRLWCHKRH
ncbi:DUF3487 family protein [Cysteiniphilum marinum]|uniref:DUF3487 family protein n=1 Tax=Cysteiniphilum marinum TaxID=2774191 RepID=UPI00193946DB|nr:DUF3487 family protein [Cysteiniphilum marinum]